MLTSMLVIVTAGLLAAPEKPDDSVKVDQKKFDGTWVLTAAEERGKEISADEVKKADLRFVFAGAKVTMKLPKNDGKEEEATVTIDTAKKPKQISLRSKETEMRGIYELDGDTLKLCLVKDQDRDVPTEFTTTAGDGRAVLVFKREKK